ncbi:MAG TPA: tRNA (adenosine(37)-N6)-threonylcarbamoyltransferase complex ATPase subunit type 1 TsaE [Lacipirellulaceae bacterium]|jgi:tRNA threonylcarbamoyladenosine biosynthesis protein TsaE|nr:tRNA (adenosine(37)-N6)-threonylcarbamoyltransferase complex ATPase subunit type 1 TsaE [Lacipirellulaceae bacterium]
MFTFTSHNEQDTDRLGAALAAVLPPGTVIALIGTLGAGKTRLVRAVAAAVGVSRAAVTSPTFVLINEYTSGRLPIYHFDTYRLKDDDEFLNLGPNEYFDSNSLSFVEWADRVENLLPTDRLEITIDITGETSRQISIRGTTPKTESDAAAIQSACGLA